MNGELDWTAAVEGERWYVIIGNAGKGGSSSAGTALTWCGPAPDETSARARALADVRRAFAVSAAMRGAEASLPTEISRIRSCEEDENPQWPSLQTGAAMRAALELLGTRRARWTEDAVEAIGDCALRCAAAKADLLPGSGLIAVYGAEGRRSQINEPTFMIAACDSDATPEGIEIGQPTHDLATPEPLRAALLALAIANQAAADERGDASDGFAHLSVPESATLRAAMRASLASTQATDAATVARFLEEAGLAEDASAFLKAFGS